MSSVTSALLEKSDFRGNSYEDFYRRQNEIKAYHKAYYAKNKDHLKQANSQRYKKKALRLTDEELQKYAGDAKMVSKFMATLQFMQKMYPDDLHEIFSNL